MNEIQIIQAFSKMEKLKELTNEEVENLINYMGGDSEDQKFYNLIYKIGNFSSAIDSNYSSEEIYNYMSALLDKILSKMNLSRIFNKDEKKVLLAYIIFQRAQKNGLNFFNSENKDEFAYNLLLDIKDKDYPDKLIFNFFYEALQCALQLLVQYFDFTNKELAYSIAEIINQTPNYQPKDIF